jgi:hypothetical protein
MFGALYTDEGSAWWTLACVRARDARCISITCHTHVLHVTRMCYMSHACVTYHTPCNRRNVVDDVPEWLHIWTPSIHDEVTQRYTHI